MMNPKEMKRLRDYATLPILITVIMFFAPSFIIDPQVDNLVSMEGGFDRVLKSSRETLGQRAADRKLAERMESLAGNLAAIDRWLPPDSFLPTLIDQFNDLAGICGVGIQSVFYRTEKNREDLLPPRIGMSIQVSADYRGMKAFLTALEGLPSPIVLTEVIANENRTFTVSLMQMVKP